MKVKEVLTAIGAERFFGGDKTQPRQLMTKWGRRFWRAVIQSRLRSIRDRSLCVIIIRF